MPVLYNEWPDTAVSGQPNRQIDYRHFVKTPAISRSEAERLVFYLATGWPLHLTQYGVTSPQGLPRDVRPELPIGFAWPSALFTIGLDEDSGIGQIVGFSLPGDIRYSSEIRTAEGRRIVIPRNFLRLGVPDDWTGGDYADVRYQFDCGFKPIGVLNHV